MKMVTKYLNTQLFKQNIDTIIYFFKCHINIMKLRKYIAHVNIFEAAVIIDKQTLVTYSHSTHSQ